MLKTGFKLFSSVFDIAIMKWGYIQTWQNKIRLTVSGLFRLRPVCRAPSLPTPANGNPFPKSFYFFLVEDDWKRGCQFSHLNYKIDSIFSKTDTDITDNKIIVFDIIIYIYIYNIHISFLGNQISNSRPFILRVKCSIIPEVLYQIPDFLFI